jgi:dolichol-phosphate mannosyltransferase
VLAELESSRGAVVLPSYNETESISKLILELDSSLPPQWEMVVVDDSPTNETQRNVLEAFQSANRDPSKLHILRNEGKSGRGAAVQRGIGFCMSNLNPEFIIEMDSDGSHTVDSVMRLVSAPKTHEFVIGSRYLKDSKILGWPLLRRVFSILTNMMLRRVFRAQLSDWTNGLRRYSVKASLIQLDHQFTNKGFICLSEQALLLREHEINPFEVPIVFIDRTHGVSTITHMEIWQSVKGIFGLYRQWR